MKKVALVLEALSRLIQESKIEDLGVLEKQLMEAAKAASIREELLRKEQFERNHPVLQPVWCAACGAYEKWPDGLHGPAPKGGWPEWSPEGPYGTGDCRAGSPYVNLEGSACWPARAGIDD